MKYVGIHLGEYIQDLCAKNYKMLVKKKRTLIKYSSSTVGLAQDLAQAKQGRRTEEGPQTTWEETDDIGRQACAAFTRLVSMR